MQHILRVVLQVDVRRVVREWLVVKVVGVSGQLSLLVHTLLEEACDVLLANPVRLLHSKKCKRLVLLLPRSLFYFEQSLLAICLVGTGQNGVGCCRRDNFLVGDRCGGRESSDSRMLEELPHVEGDARACRLANEFETDERITTERKEVVVEANGFRIDLLLFFF